VCEPLAGVDRSRYVLVLAGAEPRPAYPESDGPRRSARSGKQRARTEKRSGAK